MKVFKKHQKILIKYFKYIDQYPCEFKFRVDEQNEKYRSIPGGLASLLIYIAALIYLVYLSIQWADGQFLPKIISQNRLFEGFNQVHMKRSPVVIQIKSSINIIKKIGNKKFFVPSLDKFAGNELISPKVYNYSTLQKTAPDVIQQAFSLDINDEFSKTLTTDPSNSTNDESYMLGIEICDSKKDIECVDEKIVEEFFNDISSTTTFTLQYEQFDIQQRRLTQVSQTYQFIADLKFRNLVKLRLKKANLNLDHNPFYRESNTKTLIKDAQILYEQLSPESMLQKLGKNYLISFFIGLDRQEEITDIQFLKFSEFLAMFGSIFSMLLILGQPVQILNQFLMKKYIYQKYFDDFGTNIPQENRKKIMNKLQIQLDERLNIIQLSLQLARIEQCLYVILGPEIYLAVANKNDTPKIDLDKSINELIKEQPKDSHNEPDKQGFFKHHSNGSLGEVLFDQSKLTSFYKHYFKLDQFESEVNKIHSNEKEIKISPMRNSQ